MDHDFRKLSHFPKVNFGFKCIFSQLHFMYWFQTLNLFKKKDLCIYLRDRKQGEAEGDGERIWSRVHTKHWAQSLKQGLIPQPGDHDLSWDQELDAQPNEPLRHPLNTNLLSDIWFIVIFSQSLACVFLLFFNVALWRTKFF